jgi:hypothetical protein
MPCDAPIFQPGTRGTERESLRKLVALGWLEPIGWALGMLVSHFFFPKTGEPILSAFQSKKS